MAITADGVAMNGLTPHDSQPAPQSAASQTIDAGGDAPLAALRRRPVNVHLFKGYGPLVVGVILFVLMVTLAPTVAPERVVETPVNATTEEEAP
jgi:hypothetical protein